MALVVGPGGNSFAGPHAAAVAALMLSVNPDLCPWEVKTLMEATSRDIGPKGRDYTYGVGLLQAQKAVQAARKKAK
jgi:subtilisin family serine protease